MRLRFCALCPARVGSARIRGLDDRYGRPDAYLALEQRRAGYVS
jgi:hypothetical protein